MRLRFLWPDMRKGILIWVRSCATCIQAQSTKFTSRQLVHSWPLLPFFDKLSIDIWSPGEITSPTGAKCMLNSMYNIKKFVCAVALSHINAAQLARAFMKSTLLKFGFCIVVVVDDDSKFMALFEAMAKALNIRLHRVTERNHKVIGVERFHKFLNHNATIISSTRQTHKCFVEVVLISAYTWNAMLIDGTDIIRSIPTIGRPLEFPMNVALLELPIPIGDAATSYSKLYPTDWKRCSVC